MGTYGTVFLYCVMDSVIARCKYEENIVSFKKKSQLRKDSATTGTKTDHYKRMWECKDRDSHRRRKIYTTEDLQRNYASTEPEIKSSG